MIGKLPPPPVAKHGICRYCDIVLTRSNRHCPSPNCIWCKDCVAANDAAVRAAAVAS